MGQVAMFPKQVLDFWFNEIEPKQWWLKDPGFDALVIDRFGSVHTRAHAGELMGWRVSAQGRLAEIIVLDQFSRNMFRDSRQAFSSDEMALALAKEAVESQADLELTLDERSFLYMPFMHSESLKVHREAAKLFEQNARPETFESYARHRRVIERFGRYPHRNAIVGRASTVQETAFLKEPGSSF